MMTTMHTPATTPAEALATYCARQSTNVLAQSMVDIDVPNMSREQIIAQFAIFDELEQRHPETDCVMDKWFGDESDEGVDFIDRHSYAELLLLALLAVGAV